MADTIHDPILASRMGHIIFRESWEVSVIKGPCKSYIGRVRKVWRDGVEVEFEANRRIVKIKPEHLMRRRYVSFFVPKCDF